MMVVTDKAGILSQQRLSYELLKTNVDDSGEMRYTTYGVRATDSSGSCVFECLDISTSREYVAGFISAIEGKDVAAVHIADILEDYLD